MSCGESTHLFNSCAYLVVLEETQTETPEVALVRKQCLFNASTSSADSHPKSEPFGQGGIALHTYVSFLLHISSLSSI